MASSWGVSWGVSWGNSWGAASAAVTTRDQGAGAGSRHQGFSSKTIQDRLKLQGLVSKQLEQKLADEEKQKTQNSPVAVPDKPEKKAHIRPNYRKPKIGDVTEIKSELAKLKFSVSEEILLQQEEDEAIFMLMGIAIH